MFKVILLASLTALPACATLVNGSSQSITVSTTPPAATCTLDRVGVRIGAIALTPGSVHIDKSKNDISVTCTKDGFVAATVAKSPSFGGATFGNILAGGVIGVVVDAASGANYTYPDEIKVDLAAVPPAAVLPMASDASPALMLPVVDIVVPETGRAHHGSRAVGDVAIQPAVARYLPAN